MMNYADIETEKNLKQLEKKIYREYQDAYHEMHVTAQEYFKNLETRKIIEEKALQKGVYDEASFKLWYKTQIERGKGYEHMRDQLAQRMVEANKVASAYINDKTPSIYSLNYNHEAYRIEGAHPSVRFDIYDEQTVRKLIEGDNAVEFRTVNPNPTRDYNWNREQITSALTSGILQGKSIDKLADSFLTVMERNRTSAMRNARTAFTSAQNGGRQESYKRARQMGITMQKEWLATMDERTRASHGRLDGERVDTDKPFSNDLMYPADPDGAPSEVYNCRCTMFAVLPDVNDEKRETYSDWISRKQKEMEGKEAKSEKEKELKKAIERWNASHYRNDQKSETREIFETKSQQIKTEQPKAEHTKAEEPKAQRQAKTDAGRAEQWANELTHNERQAVEWYVSGDGMEANNYLRKRGWFAEGHEADDYLKAQMKALDSAIDKYGGIKEDGTYYRNVDASAFFNPAQIRTMEDFAWGDNDGASLKAIIGKEFVDKGYLSTTTDKELVEEWGDFTGSSHPIIVEYDVKAGAKGANLKAFDIEGDEQNETLFGRNSRAKVTGIEVGTYHMIVVKARMI